MLYFAYGANMDLLTLAERQISHQIIGPGWVENCHLTFQMPGRDGTGKADIPEQSDSVVEGVVYEVPEESLMLLDIYEGIGSGHYARKFIQVQTEDGLLECMVYRALLIEKGLHPSDDYLARLLRGAHTHGLSEAYKKFLRDHETMPLTGV